MTFIKKYFLFLFSLGIIIIFFITRFYHILSLPIFTDEAIYVRWSQIAKNDATWRFISLTDGKQPMFVWIAMIFMKFIHDPLLAGRVVSVIAGFLSTIGIFFLTSEMFKNKKIGLLASMIYVLYPFSLVYDRMALYDSLVAMFIIWSLYFEVLLVRHIRLDLGLILGMIIGGGMLTKTNADFAFVFLPLSLLLFNFKDKKRKDKLIKWAIYAGVATVIANAMYAILRLSPFYHIINDKNHVFIYSIHDWVQSPFAYFTGNFTGLFGWLVGYATVPFLILVVASFLVGKKFLFEKIFLVFSFLLPFIYLAFFGKVIYPRFLLFMTMPLLVLGSETLFQMLIFLKQIWLRTAVLVVFLAMFVFNDFFILTNFAAAVIPQPDKSQFLASWPSGVGVRETVDFLEQKSQQGKIFVGTEGTFGLMPYSLEMYFVNNPNVKIVAYWPISDTTPKDVIEASRKMPTYFVFYQPCPPCQAIGQAPPLWPVNQVFQVQKLEKGTYYTLYQVQPR